MEMKIFVVDDDSANLMVADHILSQNGIAVTPLDSGKKLLDAIKKDSLPDLILLDIKMPVMDGFATLDRLREKEKELGINEIPVIFLTADDTADTEKQGFEAGVSDYIRKPFDPDILLRRVYNIISKEKRMSSLRNEADTDKLTGFLNKSAASRIISRLCRSDLGCLMMIDLDSFKLVNDLYGHKTGDDILISFAAILRSTLPEDSKLGRIGGDEFIAFVPNLQSEEAIAAAADNMNRSLIAKAKELMGEDMDIPLGASVGAVLVPQHGDDYEELIIIADKALYNIKKNGKHGYSLHRSDSKDSAETMDSSCTISRLSELLGERSIPNVALQLDKEAFAYVYRYIMRYIMRNQGCIYKVLFTLDAAGNISEHIHKELCDEFGEILRESLRKSDILMRSRFNQYFVLLTDIKKYDIDVVIGNIMHRWERFGNEGLKISYESEFVHDLSTTPPKNNDIHITLADCDEANLKQTGTALCQAGFRVSAMKSCKALLKYLSENNTELILLSTSLNDMTGAEAMKLLSNTSAGSVPVVFIVPDGDGAAENELEALRSGAEDVIRKSCPPELLIHRIRRITECAEIHRCCGSSGK